MLRVSAYLALALAAASLPLGGGATAQGGLQSTHPQHFSSGPGHLPKVQDNSTTAPDPKPRSRILMARARDLTRNARANARLSRACRGGAFRQRRDHAYAVRLGERLYGAAIGGSASLFDPQGLGNLGMVYAFVDQGTTRCRVYPVGPYRA